MATMSPIRRRSIRNSAQLTSSTSLCRALQAKGMGLVLDIVPNHMAASLENPWWFDVLEKGESRIMPRSST